MRLTEFEISTIKTLAKEIFGKDASVSLFGSRVNDQMKGGDIDLFISNADEHSLKKKVVFLAEIKKRIGDQKIDVVFDNEYTRRQSGFYKSIIKNAINL
jgi:predicted nucleotidyltransferase